MKFKAKQAIDTLFLRFGDGLAALTVLVGVHWLELLPMRLFWLNVALGVVWVFQARQVIELRKPLLP